MQCDSLPFEIWWLILEQIDTFEWSLFTAYRINKWWQKFISRYIESCYMDHKSSAITDAILARIVNIKTLQITNDIKSKLYISEQGLLALTQLRSLHLESIATPNLTRGCLLNLTSLTSLTIRGNTYLPLKSPLQQLTIYDNQNVSDKHIISFSNTLESLAIDNAPNITDEAINKLTNLTHLTIKWMRSRNRGNNIHGFGFATLPKLTHLHVSHLEQVPFYHLFPSLKYFATDHCMARENIGKLLQLPLMRLEELYLAGELVLSERLLDQFSNLRYLRTRYLICNQNVMNYELPLLTQVVVDESRYNSLKEAIEMDTEIEIDDDWDDDEF